MKKFNVKALSLAVAAAVVSSAAGAAERDLGSIPEKAQNAMAFQTVFGENTKFDEDTGKFTFDKNSSALLLKTMELEQAVNGFAAGSNFVATNEDGSKTVREATNADIEADSMKGVGLAGGITAVNTRVDNLAKDIDEALDEQDQTVEQLKAAITSNNEHIAKVAGDVAEMGKEVSAKFDEVDEEITKASTELSESIEKVAGDVTAVNKRVDTLEQDTAAAKASAKAAEDKVTELSANVDSKVKEAKDAAKAAEDKVTELSANVDGKVKEAKDAADKAVDAASKIDAVAEKADKASKGVAGLTVALEKVSEQALLASAENAQALNGFAEGDEIVVTDKDGIKSIKTATKEDVENADFEGMGLKEVVAAHDETLDGLTNAVTENSEALVKTAEVVNAISADVNANKAALEEQEKANEGFNNAIASLDEDISTLKKVGLAAAEALEVNRQDIDANKAAIETKADKADFEELAKYTDNMGKKVNDIGDEVTALSDATNAAITRHDKDIVDLAQAGLKATEALEANRKDIDANKQGIVDLTKGLQLAAEAVEDNRKEIDANKAAIETKADKADFEALAKYTDNMGKKVNDIGDEVTALSDATNAAITRHDKDIVDLAQAGLKATEALEANRKDIDANKQGIVDLTKGLQLAAEAVEDNRKEIDANKAAIETKADKADFEALAKYTDNMGKKVNDIGDEVTALSDATNAAITRHDKDIVDLAQAGLKATEALEANRKDIDANRKDIDTNKAATMENAQALNGFAAGDEIVVTDNDGIKSVKKATQADVEADGFGGLGLKEVVAAHDEALGDLTETVNDNSEALVKTAQVVNDISADVKANTAAIETKADKAAVETSKNAALEAEKSAKAAAGSAQAAQKAADANAAQVETNKADIVTLKTASSQHATDIATLQTASNQHAAGIAKNSARIDSLDKNVANLRKETRQGLAAQAALSGLFQPYSVGKFNVTAALGGFKSDTAVAVGAGYRFNENFAAKAGLAVGTSSGSSASYNVGVNYEW